MSFVTATVITATTGRESVLNCISSVASQQGSRLAEIQHIVVTDGILAYNELYNKINGYNSFKNLDVIKLPYSVGQDRWNGHKIYAAATYFAKGEYIMYLDDDNTIEPYHIEHCLEAIQSGQYGWAYSLRNIVNEHGGFLCHDDCESLGPDYPTILNKDDHLVDVNCYFLHHKLAVYMTPIWHRKAREPGVMEVDRALCHVLPQQAKGICTGKYTVNYTAGSTGISVRKEFFLKGNEEMAKRYPGGFPWRK